MEKINLFMKKFLLLIASFVIVSSGLFAQGQLQQLPNDPSVRVGKLDNGLTYYIRHNELPSGRAEFYLATHVGAIQETPDQDGLAHFLEHMCFNGTKNFPGKGILDYLQSIGASFGGNVNASTGVEQTVYMLTNIPILRESVIDSCILIMHDYAHYVTCDPAEIDKERGVIIEERRARRTADWRMHEKSLPYYYGDSKYGTCTLIGSQENLQNFKPESLTNFYHTWYHPGNQAFIVVGDVDVDATEQKIKTIFGEIPTQENPKVKDEIRIPDNAEPLIGVLTDPEATRTALEVIWKSESLPKMFNSTLQGRLFDTMKQLIGIIMNERLGDIVARPDAPFLSARLAIGNMCEHMTVVMGNVMCAEGASLSSFEAFFTEMEKMKRFGFTDDEVSRAKDQIMAMYENAAKSADTRKNDELVYELIDNFFDNAAFVEPATDLQIAQSILPMLSAPMLSQMAAEMITKENLVVLCKAPEKEGLVTPKVEDFSAIITKVRDSEIQANATEALEKDLLDASALKGSTIKKEYAGLYGSTVLELSNGAKVILYPSELEKDKISFNLVKKGGLSLIEDADLDSFEDNVLTLFMNNSGISRFSKTTVDKMTAGKNFSASPYIGSTRHGVKGTSTVKDIETALQCVYLYFADPRFDPNEYDQSIKTISAILPNLMEQPNYKLQSAMYSTMYGNNPRKKMISVETLEKASLATIEKGYRKLFADAAGAVVVIGGDFKVDEIKPLVLKYIGSIAKGKKATDWLDRGVDFANGEVVNDFTADMQTPMTTVVDVYHAPFARYSFADNVALKAASYILDMRYVTSLREDEGGTYGAQTSASLQTEPKNVGYIQIYYNSKPSSADKLRSLAVKDLKALAEEGPSAEEFDMALKNLQKNIPESRLNLSHWTGALISHELLGFDSDKDYEEAVNALTADSVKNIVKRILDAGNALEVVMRPGVSAEAE